MIIIYDGIPCSIYLCGSHFPDIVASPTRRLRVSLEQRRLCSFISIVAMVHALAIAGRSRVGHLPIPRIRGQSLHRSTRSKALLAYKRRGACSRTPAGCLYPSTTVSNSSSTAVYIRSHPGPASPTLVCAIGITLILAASKGYSLRDLRSSYEMIHSTNKYVGKYRNVW